MSEVEAINPIIRKITYQVGQKMLAGKLHITAIIQDEAAWYKHQQVVYDVYIKFEGEEFSRPWKRFFSQPIAIEFDVEEREHYQVN